MKQKRDKVYIWVTWLTKLISGEQQCEFQSWFKAHFKHDKISTGNFSLTKWSIQHNQLVHKCRDELEKEGYVVKTEDQNSFKFKLPDGSMVSGKADLVAISDKIPNKVIDCKTGQQRNSDQVQVLFYMIFLPICIEEYADVSFDGIVRYKDDTEIPIFKVDIDDVLKEVVWDLIKKVSGDEPLRKVPSYNECSYCDISKKDCPERID